MLNAVQVTKWPKFKPHVCQLNDTLKSPCQAVRFSHKQGQYFVWDLAGEFNRCSGIPLLHILDKPHNGKTGYKVGARQYLFNKITNAT
jgi:hypothetical protein